MSRTFAIFLKSPDQSYAEFKADIQAFTGNTGDIPALIKTEFRPFAALEALPADDFIVAEFPDMVSAKHWYFSVVHERLLLNSANTTASSPVFAEVKP